MTGRASFRRPFLLAACLLICASLLPACAGKSPAPASPEDSVRAKTASSAEQKVVRLARSLIGAPYTWGGYSPKTGFDCSGLVWYVYYQNGVNLPRMTMQQMRAGQPVQRPDIRPGDLVFHQADKDGKTLHVGVVTDRGTFVHAPGSGKRVMESSLNSPFWAAHYLGARRVLRQTP